VVQAAGEVDLYTAPELDQALKQAARRGIRAVIVDLTNIAYLDSAGLSTLLRAQRELSGRDAALYVIAPPGTPGVRRALEITRLDMLMRVRDSLASALRELRMRAAA